MHAYFSATFAPAFDRGTIDASFWLGPLSPLPDESFDLCDAIRQPCPIKAGSAVVEDINVPALICVADLMLENPQTKVRSRAGVEVRRSKSAD